jgi:hypothetical protein
METKMRTLSQWRNDADRNATAAELGRALGAADLDRIAAAGGPNSGGVASGGSSGGNFR